MAKFGVFNMGSRGLGPVHEFEGDYMQQNNEFVGIWKKPTNPDELGSQVAAIHLDKGQAVKKISD